MHTHTTPDSLDDVILDGRYLVSDDPTTWLVPQAMRVVEDRGDLDSDIFAWWDKLHSVDEALHAFGGVDSVLHELRTTWQTVYGSVAAQHRFDGEAGAHTTGRRCIADAMNLGLALGQVANLLGISSQEAIRVLYQNMAPSEPDVEAFVQADALLRLGRLTQVAIGREVGLSPHRIQHYAKTVGIVSPIGGGRSIKNPSSVKRAFLELLSTGLTTRRVVAQLKDELPEARHLTEACAYQWACRAGLTTKRATAA